MPHSKNNQDNQTLLTNPRMLAMRKVTFKAIRALSLCLIPMMHHETEPIRKAI